MTKHFARISSTEKKSSPLRGKLYETPRGAQPSAEPGAAGAGGPASSLSASPKAIRVFSFVSLPLLLILTAVPAHAVKTDADQPINVRARSVDTNEKTGVTVYRGDVVFTQGSIRIQA